MLEFSTSSKCMELVSKYAIGKVMIFILFSFLSACAETHHSSDDLKDRFGVVGEFDLRLEKGPDHMRSIERAVGLIIVLDGERISVSGVGTLVSTGEIASAQLITAKHLFYHPDTLLKREGIAFWMDDTSERIFEVDLEQIPSSIPEWSFEEDYLVLDTPLPEKAGVYLDFQTTNSSDSNSSNCDDENNSSYVVFTSIASDEYTGPAWQKDAEVKCSKSLRRPLMLTNFDGFKGTSGSPVFKETSDGSAEFVGIFVGMRKFGDCQQNSNLCQNIVLRIAFEEISNQEKTDQAPSFDDR